MEDDGRETFDMRQPEVVDAIVEHKCGTGVDAREPAATVSWSMPDTWPYKEAQPRQRAEPGCLWLRVQGIGHRVYGDSPPTRQRRTLLIRTSSTLYPRMPAMD